MDGGSASGKSTPTRAHPPENNYGSLPRPSTRTKREPVLIRILKIRLVGKDEFDEDFIEVDIPLHQVRLSANEGIALCVRTYV